MRGLLHIRTLFFGLLLLGSCAVPTRLGWRPVPAKQVPYTDTLAFGAHCTLEPNDAIHRLACLGRIWGAVRIFHPHLQTLAVDWDAALVDALPAVLVATNEDAFASAVDRMLAALEDSTSGVFQRATGELAQPRLIESRGKVPVVRLGSARPEDLTRVRDAIRSATSIVIDLRVPRDIVASQSVTAAIEALGSLLVARDTAAVPVRWVKHDGWVPQAGASTAGYATTFVTSPPKVYRSAAAQAPRIAFVVNDVVGVPSLVAALRSTGSALVIAEGRVSDMTVASSMLSAFGSQHTVAISRAAYAVPPEFDEQLGSEVPSGTAIDAAVAALARRGVSSVVGPSGSSCVACRYAVNIISKRSMTDVHLVDDGYAAERLPPLAHRMLALFRLWTVIHYFYPYLALLDSSWDDTLVEFVPRFEGATSALEYERVIHELSARVPDSHVLVRGDEAFRQSLGEGFLPVEVTRIDRLPVVTKVGESARAAGIAVGDVLVDVAGEAFPTRSARLARYFAASNAWEQDDVDDVSALRCALGSTTVLHIRNVQNAVYEVALTCGASVPRERTTPVISKIAPDLGYVDLGRLELGDVDTMFDQLRGTRGIVFDMRGYPHGTASAIAARLNSHLEPTVGAQVYRVFVGANENEPSTVRAAAPVYIGRPRANTYIYTGMTVMLIDQSTISQAEHTGLLFEAANETKFVGSPSAGADGNVTNICLPGAIYVTFTGLEVRHADGRQLQRVGIQPDVVVRPTIAGVRTGRDEVLERAVALLRDELSSSR